MNIKIGIMAAVLMLGGVFWRVSAQSSISETTHEPTVETKPTHTLTPVEITEGSTFGFLMEESGVTTTDRISIFDTAQNVYDLSNIRLGRTIDLYYDNETGEFQKLLYQIDTEEELIVEKTIVSSTSKWVAQRVPIEYETKIVQKSGTVESSMYQAALDAGIDIRAIIDLAEVFQWSVDFALDPRVGDTFEFIYEERYRDGEYVMPANILAGTYRNAGRLYQGYYFDDNIEAGYFDEKGNSVQKMFLKAPVHFKYISSGFTTGSRYVAAFNVSTGHRAIDYAAPAGTPIRATSDGTVRSAGWSSVGYGNLTSIRHNATYSTNYAHQSKIVVRPGQKVKQGEVIGYVGSTGFSTGPHLHYEMVKHGIKINPLTEEFPSGKPIADELKQVYFDTIDQWQKKLTTQN